MASSDVKQPGRNLPPENAMKGQELRGVHITLASLALPPRASEACLKPACMSPHPVWMDLKCPWGGAGHEPSSPQLPASGRLDGRWFLTTS